MNEYGKTAFDLVYPDLVVGENSVPCCFHHDDTPSLSIDTQKRIYHCFGCGAKGNENDFIMQYYGIDRNQVTAFKEILMKSDCLDDYETFARGGKLYKSNFTYTELVRMGINEELLEDLKVGVEVYSEFNEDTGIMDIKQNTSSTRLVFPIICKGRILDNRAYTIDKSVTPKCLSKPNVQGGLVLPYHLWKDDMMPTVICEGEKDMLFARAHGYNAISLGGCNNIPTVFLQDFKDRYVYIVYDNDAAGRVGAQKLASALFSVTKYVFIADISKYVKEDKEDVTDFFVKYKHTKDDFDELLTNATEFDTDANEAYLKKSYPEVSLNEASTVYLGKTVRSNVQVVATYEEQFSVPGYASFIKEASTGKEESNKHLKGDSEYWTLQKSNFDDILVLTDNNLKKQQICDNLRQLVGWGNEDHVKVNLANYKTIFKAIVADCTESVVVKEIKRTEFICYTDTKLEAGKNYQIIYKVVPHPYKGQQQVLIVTDVKESGDVITAFEVTPAAIDDLKVFQGVPFYELQEKQKYYVNFNVDNRLLLLIDLWYHTPKAFNFGRFTEIKGFLDGLIVTESRTGKSSTAQALSKLYGLGQIASLAGSAATPAGLIGGSVKAGGSSAIRPGLIPRQHNRSIIFEELAKAKYSLIPELTDIRSSGLVRINRSTGDLTLPGSVRMLFLSNAKSDDEGLARPIISYPNGIEVIKPLIGSVEDIARFDFIYVLADTPREIDPLWTPKEGFTEKQLQTRIRWIWSRTTDQIKLSNEVQRYIVEKSTALNKDYLCSVRIFSTETWKKVSRMAIAIAGYTVSTDMEFQDIIVTKKHVDIACAILKSLYDNPIFKLKEFVEEERKKLDCSLNDLKTIEELVSRHPIAMRYLSINGSVAKNSLKTISGLDELNFNNLLQALTSENFITMTRDKICPTPKFLTAIKKIEMTTTKGV